MAVLLQLRTLQSDIAGRSEPEHCPVCNRRTSLLYLCDRCFTISFESDTPLEAKNFTLTTEGLPLPSCAGCLQESSGEVREHACDELGASFTTAVTTCPICRERLDIGPSFPNLASVYLRKTNASRKLNVTFDYDTGLFVEVEDGEFVIVTDSAEGDQGMVLPRLTQFSDSREFYEMYQDYYHHRAKLRAGEVFVHEPALAERTDGGWAFKSAGMLEVRDDHPQHRTRKVRFGEMGVSDEQPAVAMAPTTEAEPAITPGEIETATPVSAPDLVTPPKAESTGEVCEHCGSSIEEEYAFCWNCGKPMAAKAAEPGRIKNPSRRLIIDMQGAPDPRSFRL